MIFIDKDGKKYIDNERHIDNESINDEFNIEKKVDSSEISNNNLNVIIDNFKKANETKEQLRQIRLLFETMLKHSGLRDKGGVAYTLTSLFGFHLIKHNDIKIDTSDQEKITISILGKYDNSLNLIITSSNKKDEENFEINYSHNNNRGFNNNYNIIKEPYIQNIVGKINVRNLGSENVFFYKLTDLNSKQYLTGSLRYDSNGFCCESRSNIRQFNLNLGGTFDVGHNYKRDNVNTYEEETFIIIGNNKIPFQNYQVNFEKDNLIMPYIRDMLIAVDPYFCNKRSEYIELYHQIFSEYFEKIMGQYSNNNAIK